MFGWKGRRKTSKSSSGSGAKSDAAPQDDASSEKRSAQPTTTTAPEPAETAPAADAPPPPRHRRRSLSAPSPSTHTAGDAWSSDGADIGITNITVSSGDSRRAVLLYEISLQFPALGWLWVVHRSYADFVALHAEIERDFARQLQARKVRLPRAARLSWESFRASMGADDTAAKRLLAKLNTYLHKLLEIEPVHMSRGFRAFLTPRTDSLDMECRGRQPKHVLGRSAPLLPELTAHSVALAAPAESLCTKVVHFGSAVSFMALGGLQIGLTRRGALSGSHKAAAVAAGVAGVALTGPLSAVFALGALGGGMGKYQLNKAYYLSVGKPRATNASRLRARLPSQSDDSSDGAKSDAVVSDAQCFLVENAAMFSGPRRVVKFGDLIHLYCPSVRKSVRIAQPPDSKRGHLMVTNTESRAATLRLVSPYGYTGTIGCGSQVYVQVVSSSWAGEFLGVHGDFLSSGKSPTVFKVTAQDDHGCGELSTAAPTETPSLESTVIRTLSLTPFKLRVMAYNVWLMPGILSSFNGKLSPFALHRARAIPLCVQSLDVDVVVFCEAFCSSAREVLVSGMKEQGFLYETKVVGAGASMASKKAIDGGCFAMSRYPIESFQELTFGSVAAGDDRMADKGVVYFTVHIGGGAAAQTVHVFGTHLQAWETPGAVAARTNQLQLLREFMDSLQLPPTDAVLVVGDLNVNKSASEYASMLESLRVVEPELVPHSSAFSFDPFTNELAVDGPSSSGETERLDYVLVAEHHRAPVQATSEIVQLKATSAWEVPRGEPDEKLVDLSDHYPVVAELHF